MSPATSVSANCYPPRVAVELELVVARRSTTESPARGGHDGHWRSAQAHAPLHCAFLAFVIE
eukprot:7942530-Pyramimonas_sp.AAC.1